MKRGGIIFSVAVCILLISSVSAYSLSEVLSQLDETTLLLGLLFVVSFALINFSLSKLFDSQRGIASIIAFSASLIITYEVNRVGFDIAGFITSFGISSELLFILVPIILIAGLIYLIWKFTLRGVLLIAGALLMGISFTDLVYEKQTLFVIGLILFLIGLWLYIRRGKTGEEIEEIKGRSFWDIFKRKRRREPRISHAEAKERIRDKIVYLTRRINIIENANGGRQTGQSKRLRNAVIKLKLMHNNF